MVHSTLFTVKDSNENKGALWKLKKQWWSAGTGGIGAAIVRELAKEGRQVFVGYHRNAEKAEQLAADCGDRVIPSKWMCAMKGRWRGFLIRLTGSWTMSPWMPW